MCGPVSFPAFSSNLKGLSLQTIHAKTSSFSTFHPIMSDATKCGSLKTTKSTYRMVQPVVFASLAWICMASVPSFTAAEGMNDVTGEILFQTRCYQCHAGKDYVKGPT
jgi:hypothetical protein